MDINLCRRPTPIHVLDNIVDDNHLFIKREDLCGFVVGGNKVRKLDFFLSDLFSEGADCVVTYGSAQSNHCAAVAAAAATVGLPCHLILARSEGEPTYQGNFFLYDLFDADICWTEVEEVKTTIDRELSALKAKGLHPYFIPGGGHGNLGTRAYVEAFQEICDQEKELGVEFDFIFHASGTGTTQAGLIVGNILAGQKKKIIGISIARSQKRGVEVIQNSIDDYLQEEEIQVQDTVSIHFEDRYTAGGYGQASCAILQTVKNTACREGLLLDPVYTGKAFYGMLEYLEYHAIRESNILFLHTGGLPLLFDNAEKFRSDCEGEL